MTFARLKPSQRTPVSGRISISRRSRVGGTVNVESMAEISVASFSSMYLVQSSRIFSADLYRHLGEASG